MRILVTGGNGFVGSFVAERLAAQGHALRLLLRVTSDTSFLDGLSGEYERVNGDLRDPDSLIAAVKGVETVIHLGGLTSARTEAEYQAANGQGTASLARLAMECGVKRFVYVSSLAAHGPSPDGQPRPVDAAPNPITAYGRSKLAGETAVLAEAGRMSVVVLRPPAVYGPRDKALLPLYRIARRGILPVIGDGNNVVSFVHVYDAADAIVRVALAEGQPGAIYPFSDEMPHTWRELAKAYGDAIGRRVRCVSTPVPLYAAAGYGGGLVSTLLRRSLPLSPEEVTNMRQRYWVCDSEAIKRDFDWQPQLDIQQGMRVSVRWYRERRWL